MNNISNSASPTVQHQQQITTNHVQSPQQQRTPSAASKQQSHPAVNDQSQLKNGSTPTLQNHQPYPRSQFPTQQTPQPQQHSINHIIKTPEATPRNSEYLQQQQSKNLDARGRPSPAQGTTAPETDPTQTIYGSNRAPTSTGTPSTGWRPSGWYTNKYTARTPANIRCRGIATGRDECRTETDSHNTGNVNRCFRSPDEDANNHHNSPNDAIKFQSTANATAANTPTAANPQ
ncbi:uncharacterized protein LOC110680396 [Aedes aegypti]|uniref:Uncharacterized protein n=1 Tax=Aedes aegypti TaxID=7159 RepID=A0A903VHJ4_AEDAE|nr:uncharacterized protein LOC110680396 [Aedes aegypti]